MARARHWASIDETTFVGGMRLLFWIWRVLGRWPFRMVLYPVLLWYVLFSQRARRTSQDYLRRVHAYTPVRLGMFGVLCHFGAFAETMLDKMLLWGGMYPVEQVEYVGAAQMDALAAQGRGALLMCSHLGNLELCRFLAMRRPGVQITVLVHTKHAQAFNRLLGALDPASQLNLLQVTEMTPATAMLLSERMQQGHFVVIAGDRVPVSGGGRTTTAQFLGGPAAFPVGPYVLASVLQCPLYLLFSLQAEGRPQIHFELLREKVQLPRKDRDSVYAQLAADFAARLQHHCVRAPLQWFNFYDFWHMPQQETHDASR